MPAVRVTDPWTLYTATRDRLVGLLRSLEPDEAARRVPLTPGWTVTEVVSHLCGLNADIAAGRREQLGTPERTAHQVAVRAGRNIDEVCREWLGHAEAMRKAMEEDAFLGQRLAADLVVHSQDIHHALGVPIDRDDDATISAAHAYGRVVIERMADPGRIGFAIELSDGTRFATTTGVDQPPLVLRATPYDFLRSVTGRRSRRQVEALDWSGDPSEVLDDLSPYGPLRTSDADI